MNKSLVGVSGSGISVVSPRLVYSIEDAANLVAWITLLATIQDPNFPELVAKELEAAKT